MKKFLIDIPSELEFSITAENLINSAWNSLIKLISEYEILEELDSSKKILEIAAQLNVHPLTLDAATWEPASRSPLPTFWNEPGTS